MIQGRRYHINYDHLTEEDMDYFIKNFKQLYRKIKETNQILVYTSLPINGSDTKKIEIDNIEKSDEGWDPFDIGKAKIIFEADDNDDNLRRYYQGKSYSGKYFIKMKISPTYTPFYLVYTEKKIKKDLKVKNRVYTVAREQDWGDLYRNETNPSIFEKIQYFFEDL